MDKHKKNREVDDEIVRYGKINHLMEMPDVSEVMINAPNEVLVEKRGKLVLTDVEFANEEEVYALASMIASNVGRNVDKTNPIVSARLPDGTRVSIVIPPVSFKGATITLRKILGVDDFKY